MNVFRKIPNLHYMYAEPLIRREISTLKHIIQSPLPEYLLAVKGLIDPDYRDRISLAATQSHPIRPKFEICII